MINTEDRQKILNIWIIRFPEEENQSMEQNIKNVLNFPKIEKIFETTF